VVEWSSWAVKGRSDIRRCNMKGGVVHVDGIHWSIQRIIVLAEVFNPMG
jgi:hypothetical protein